MLKKIARWLLRDELVQEYSKGWLHGYSEGLCEQLERAICETDAVEQPKLRVQ